MSDKQHYSDPNRNKALQDLTAKEEDRKSDHKAGPSVTGDNAKKMQDKGDDAQMKREGFTGRIADAYEETKEEIKHPFGGSSHKNK
ncbi:MAG: hypothetical protein Q9162_003849 [Coniocarpon cinnabarinum]